MLLDLMAHAHADDPKLRHAVVTEDFEEELLRMEAEAVEREIAEVPVPESDWETVVDDRFS